MTKPRTPRDYLDDLGHDLEQFAEETRARPDAMGQLAEDGANAVRLLKRLFGAPEAAQAPQVAPRPQKPVSRRSERHADCQDAEIVDPGDVIDTTGEAVE